MLIWALNVQGTSMVKVQRSEAFGVRDKQGLCGDRF